MKKQTELNEKAEEVMNAAKAFVHYYETWEHFQEMKGSISVALPTEFIELCEAVEDFYGSPENEDEEETNTMINTDEIIEAIEEGNRQRVETIINGVRGGTSLTLFDNYQAAANAFINRGRYPNKMAYFNNAALGICGEGGEFADIVKKVQYHGIELTPEMKLKMKKELGDILWYIAEACIPLETSLEEIATLNIRKLSDRHKGLKFDEEAAKKKDESKEAIKCLHGQGYYRYGLEPQAYCHVCDAPVDADSYHDSEFKGTRYRSTVIEASNDETARKLLLRERAICRVEELRGDILLESRGKLDEERWEARLTGVVEATDVVYVPSNINEDGRYYSANDVAAINHPVTLFYQVVKMKKKTKQEIREDPTTIDPNDADRYQAIRKEALAEKPQGYELVTHDNEAQRGDLAWYPEEHKFVEAPIIGLNPLGYWCLIRKVE